MRNLTKVTQALVATTLAYQCLMYSANAAQDNITASQDALLEDIEIAIGKAELTVVEQAQTDRFAMIYAQRSDGSHVTITLHQVPPEDTDITVAVHSDTPANETLDESLLAVLLATQQVDAQTE